MTTSATHYETHLGPVYSWMLGDLDAAFARSAAEIEALPLPAARGVAVDLGAGLGLHALPLAQRGFEVVAIDNCQVLLDELQSRRGSLADRRSPCRSAGVPPLPERRGAAHRVHGRHAHAPAGAVQRRIAADRRGGSAAPRRRVRNDLSRLRQPALERRAAIHFGARGCAADLDLLSRVCEIIR